MYLKPIPKFKLNEELIKYNQNEIKSERNDLLEEIKNWHDAKKTRLQNPKKETCRKIMANIFNPPPQKKTPS